MASSSSNRFSDAQLATLETAFLEDKFVTGKRKIELAEATQLTKEQVKLWFANRRKRMKMSSKEPSDIATSSQRLRYSKVQRDTLNAEFAKSNYLERKRKVELVKTTGLTGAQITEWFRSKRKSQLKGSDREPKNPLVFTSAQRAILVEGFAKDQYLNKKRKKALAKKTKLTQQQIRTWFKHERRRVRERLEEQEDDMEIAANEDEDGHLEPIDVTPEQETILMEMFLVHRFLNLGEVANMMERTGLEEEQVKKWFKRQRELTEFDIVVKEEPEDEME